MRQGRVLRVARGGGAARTWSAVPSSPSSWLSTQFTDGKDALGKPPVYYLQRPPVFPHPSLRGKPTIPTNVWPAWRVPSAGDTETETARSPAPGALSAGVQKAPGEEGAPRALCLHSVPGPWEQGRLPAGPAEAAPWVAAAGQSWTLLLTLSLEVPWSLNELSGRIQ